MRYIKQILKWVVLLAFPVYFFFAFKPVEIKQELSLYIQSDRDSTYNVYVITQQDSTKKYQVQTRFVLKANEEAHHSIEGFGVRDTLYLYTEQRGKVAIFEYIIDTAEYNELHIADSTEFEFYGSELKDAVKSYKESAIKDIFLVILFVWLIFIVIYIRSRK